MINPWYEQGRVVKVGLWYMPVLGVIAIDKKLRTWSTPSEQYRNCRHWTKKGAEKSLEGYINLIKGRTL